MIVMYVDIEKKKIFGVYLVTNMYVNKFHIHKCVQVQVQVHSSYITIEKLSQNAIHISFLSTSEMKFFFDIPLNELSRYSIFHFLLFEINKWIKS